MVGRSLAADHGLQASGLVFGYRTPVLRGVDLHVGPGELVALLGANGAGKTTLLRLLGGLRRPDAGEVLLDGRSVEAIDARTRAHLLGYLSQRVPAHTGFAVYEMVLMGLYPLLPASGWESRAEWMAVGRALRRVGAAALLRRPFDELSGGEQRRVLLARALVTRPPILLLDEPLAALDPGFALELTDLLGQIKADGVSIVVATHRLSLARRLADRVVVLRDGEVIASGCPDEVMTAATLDAAYRTDRFSAAMPADRAAAEMAVS